MSIWMKIKQLQNYKEKFKSLNIWLKGFICGGALILFLSSVGGGSIFLYEKYVRPQEAFDQNEQVKGDTSTKVETTEEKDKTELEETDGIDKPTDNMSSQPQAVAKQVPEVPKPTPQVPPCDYECLNEKFWKNADIYLANKKQYCEQVATDINSTLTFTYERTSWFINGVYQGPKSWDCSYKENSTDGFPGGGGEAGRYNCNENYCSDNPITRIPGHR